MPSGSAVWACTPGEHTRAALQVVGVLTAGGAAVPDAETLRQLTLDVEMELNAMRNASYASGFAAAQGAITGAITKLYA